MDCFTAFFARNNSRLFGCLFRLLQIRLISEPDAVLKRGAGAPAEFGNAADVEQFSWRAVGPRGIETDRTAIADGRGHHPGEFGDRDVLAGADIDQLAAGVMLHQVNAGVREIVDIEELPPWRAGAPDHDIAKTGPLRLVKAADQRGDDVAVFGMIVVA